MLIFLSMTFVFFLSEKVGPTFKTRLSNLLIMNSLHLTIHEMVVFWNCFCWIWVWRGFVWNGKGVGRYCRNCISGGLLGSRISEAGISGEGVKLFGGGAVDGRFADLLGRTAGVDAVGWPHNKIKNEINIDKGHQVIIKQNSIFNVTHHSFAIFCWDMRLRGGGRRSLCH